MSLLDNVFDPEAWQERKWIRVAQLRVPPQDRRAFDNLQNKYHREIVGFCIYMMRSNREAGEDRAQVTFMQAWRDLNAYKAAQSAFSAWLRGIAKHRCLDAIGTNQVPQVSYDDAREVASPPEESPQNRAEGNVIWQSLRLLLNDGELLLVKLYYVEGQTAEEIAEILGIKPAAVRKRLERLREKLRRALPGIMPELEQGSEPTAEAKPKIQEDAVNNHDTTREPTGK